MTSAAIKAVMSLISTNQEQVWYHVTSKIGGANVYMSKVCETEMTAYI